MVLLDSPAASSAVHSRLDSPAIHSRVDSSHDLDIVGDPNGLDDLDGLDGHNDSFGDGPTALDLDSVVPVVEDENSLLLQQAVREKDELSLRITALEAQLASRPRAASSTESPGRPAAISEDPALLSPAQVWRSTHCRHCPVLTSPSLSMYY